MIEVVVTTGAIICAKLQSNRQHQQTDTNHFSGRMPFLSPNQQCQSTEWKKNSTEYDHMMGTHHANCHTRFHLTPQLKLQRQYAGNSRLKAHLHLEINTHENQLRRQTADEITHRQKPV